MANTNPFTPTFGQMPPALAGRTEIINDIVEGLTNGPGDPNRATIFVGARGTGKTVLLAAIAEAAQQQGWISVDVTARDGMLDEILVQTQERSAHLVAAKSDVHVTGISFSGAGVSLQRMEQLTTWRSEFTKLVSEINEQGAGVLVTVDEATAGNDDLATLSDVFQHMVREHRNIALLMAGLPQQVSLLLQDEGITFLRRARQRELGLIDFDEVVSNIRETVEKAGRSIDAAPLLHAADATNGFAFMIQLVGYEMWRRHPEQDAISSSDVEEGIALARRELVRTVFVPTMRSLTGRERAYVVAMANMVRPATNASIAKELGISANNAGNVKRRLLEQGILQEMGRMGLDFQVPFFAEYLVDAGQ